MAGKKEGGEGEEGRGKEGITLPTHILTSNLTYTYLGLACTYLHKQVPFLNFLNVSGS